MVSWDVNKMSLANSDIVNISTVSYLNKKATGSFILQYSLKK